MNSPYEYSIKMELSFNSPETSYPISNVSRKSATRLSFDDSPNSVSTNQIDESSKDSGFSDESDQDIEMEEDDTSQATHLDASFEFESFDNDSSFNNYEQFETVSIKTSNENKQQSKEEKTNDAFMNCSDDRLIGDMSRQHILPILSESRHSDLASIEPSTLVDLINGKYQDRISKFVILDARYPYEFDGGHINEAQSAFNKEEIMKKLFDRPIQNVDGKQVVLIFHCEFSIERGPKLMREVRERDRSLNQDNYPNLFYPEIYLLEGGYKQFFDSNQQLCEPRQYVPMLQDDHKNDMKFFRKKSKSWEIEKRKSYLSTKTRLLF
ncbi:unnamed protein product [Brachionus calyciflorus]|uniref:M-phase inducer phosphatase n=1 Tax=Brachionus calyciflorus TaxID=104777 RepID=A0A814B9X4_9BILA|nr:unnamed protein product [Brachionus calyciflorus]